VTAIRATEGPQAVQVGPPPSSDAELRPALDALLHVRPGGFHSFAGAVPQAALSRVAVAAHRDWLRRLLA